MKCSLTLVLISILISSSLNAGVITKPITVEHKEVFIVVKWTTDDEAGVLRFEVLRAEGNGDSYYKVGQVTELKGGNNSNYEYEDHSVFRTADRYFKYKVRVVFRDGSFSDTAAKGIPFATSAAKRTWGSIKAMFR